MKLTKKSVQVLGRQMAYRESGDPDGPPIVFLHGNPTSSFLWRNVMPHAEPHGRCLAPDLIGMGDSDKLPGEGDERYAFAAHATYLETFLDTVGVTQDVTLVVHDWGSALGFDWACRHPDRTRAIAYTESICGPLRFDEWPADGQKIFGALREAGTGEHLALEKNVFVERILPSSIMRELTAEELAEYRRPFAVAGEDRRPTLTWPRQIPFDGVPAHVASVISRYCDWLAGSELPKLYLHAEPGFMSTVFADTCRSWPNQTEVVVKGIHFVQEDSPDAIGTALASWLGSLPPAG